MALDSKPMELPVLTIIREGSALRPSLRIVGRVNGQPINVPAEDKAKALAAIERLLPYFVTAAGSVGLRAEEELPVSDPSNAEVLAAVNVLIVNSEQQNKTLADIQEHLAGVKPEEPTADDVWNVVIAQTEPPAYVIEPQTSFDREKAITQAWWGYSPINGTRVVFPPLDQQRRDWIKEVYSAGDVSEMTPVQQRFWELTARHMNLDASLYAVLTGIIKPFEWGGIGSRDEDEFIAVQNKSLEQLWHINTDVKQGGGPGEGGNG